MMDSYEIEQRLMKNPTHRVRIKTTGEYGYAASPNGHPTFLVKLKGLPNSKATHVWMDATEEIKIFALSNLELIDE